MKKIVWINQLKGVGIIAVVTGHIYVGPISDGIYLWHMPLFFLLSGYLFKPHPEKMTFFKDKAIYLLVPYLAFLVLLGSREFVAVAQVETFTNLAKYTLKDLLGGRYLLGWTGVFWFITCLFLTQQLANVLFPRFSLRVLWPLMALCLVVAFATSGLTAKWHVPWNADVVLFALPLFFLGWQYKAHGLADMRRFDLAAAVVSTLGLVLVVSGVIRTLNLKYVDYGTPGITLIFCLAVVHLLVRVTQKIPEKSFVGSALASAGQASMVIMFLHPIVHMGLQEWVTENRHIRMVLALALPWMLFYLLQRSRVTRAIFLGSKPDILSFGFISGAAGSEKRNA